MANESLLLQVIWRKVTCGTELWASYELLHMHHKDRETEEKERHTGGEEDEQRMKMSQTYSWIIKYMYY